MSEKIPCEYSKIMPCEHCRSAENGRAEEVELTPDHAKRYLPREGRDDLIIPKKCPIPALTSVIEYGPDYLIIKKGRKLRADFARQLPAYKK